MMECVVAWFCECGSIVRMSFCAAQRSVTAWTGAAISARMSTKDRMQSPLFERQALFHQRREIAGAQRNHLVIEVVVRIVQEAAPWGAALPEEHVGAGTFLQHVGEVLAAHGRLVLGDDVLGAEQALSYLRGELGLAH